MAESTLSIAYADLMNAVSDLVLRYGSDYTALSAARQAEVDRYVQSGYRKFLNPPIVPGQTLSHRWSFLRPVTTLTTVADYATGTITIESDALTTVTLADGTWPSWAASGELIISGTPYAITTRDSDTQLTLTTDAVESDGVAYSLQRRTYSMPDDFGSMDGPLTYEPSTGFGAVRIVGEAEIRRARQSGNQQGRPTIAALRPRSDTTTGTRFEMLLWPAPDDVYIMTYRYKALPNKLDATTNTYPLGGMAHSETIKWACMATAELEADGTRGARWEEFISLLATSISVDRSMAPDHFSYNGTPTTYAESEDMRAGDSYITVYGAVIN